MNSSQIIPLMITGCILYACFFIFIKPFKSFIRLIFKALMGIGAVFVLDFLLSPWSITVGINLFTACVCAILGLPGVVFLYGIVWFLG